MTANLQPLVYAADTVVGQVRGHNEDAVLCCPELGLWAVADGMGGHRRGEVASALALQALRAASVEGLELSAAVHAANAAVLAAAEADAECRGMGTTLVAVQCRGADYQIAWVGDSRAYRVDADAIEPLTHDHSWVQAMIDAGEMSEAEARCHPQRGVIFQCLGREDQSLEVGLLQGRLQPHELLLLCSDGLTGELDDGQIQQQCAAAATLDELVAALIAQANHQGGRDNISCIVLGGSPTGPAAVERPRGFLSRLFKPLKS
ncbi:serine/threonine-protein phosphatase [Pseudomonas benzenivorans]|uniref:Serine/threonine-protein phosphatase n=2 Tax=Pseudomonas benzenivorans TaxID=556533 RepID=A0ABY5H9H8_9PSED|nr:protein phosphatase 2C domain-containing protein [Pseudomonas benzenivorans]UTW08783.1 serine/threonine-protein phosphatase [Pseudomonas benzenivorans]